MALSTVKRNHPTPLCFKCDEMWFCCLL